MRWGMQSNDGRRARGRAIGSETPRRGRGTLGAAAVVLAAFLVAVGLPATSARAEAVPVADTETSSVQVPPASVVVAIDVMQNGGLAFSPFARSTTTGSFQPLTASSVGTASAGGSTGLDEEAGMVFYYPARDFLGQETLVVTVTDDLGQTGTVTYLFTVKKLGALIDADLPHYVVPVDGTVAIPLADVFAAVDVDDVLFEDVRFPHEFVGGVTVEQDRLVYRTDDSGWTGEQEFAATVQDGFGQLIDVPVSLTVVAPQMRIDRREGYAGTTAVTVTATGLAPGSEYSVELHSEPVVLGTTVADAEGVGAVTAMIPAGTEIGSHAVVLVNDSGRARAELSFEVLAAPSVEEGDPEVEESPALGHDAAVPAALALTGASGVAISIGIVLAAVLLVAGLVVIVVGRVRRTAAAGD